MQKTQIYLIRHGESLGNRTKTFLGHVDLDLTDVGHLQAERSAEFLKTISVDRIYASDLKRAYYTALHTAEKLGMDVIQSHNLREIFGGEWENKTYGELQTNYTKSYGVWLENIGCARCDGGESTEELQKRVAGEMEKIAAENEGKTVFVFTHATPIRALKTAWDGLPLTKMKDVPWASNASVTHAEYAGGTFRVLAYSIDHFMGDAATAFPRGV